MTARIYQGPVQILLQEELAESRIFQSYIQVIGSTVPLVSVAKISQAYLQLIVRTYKIEAPAETGFAFDAPGHVDREQIPVMGSFDFED